MTKLKKYMILVLPVILLLSFPACKFKNKDKKAGGQDRNPVHTEDYNDTNAPVTEPLKDGNDSEPDDGRTGPEQGEVSDTGSGNDTVSTGDNSLPEGGIIRITREEAGLSTIPTFDFSDFSLNPSMQRILENPETYTDEDYRNGLVGEWSYDRLFVLIITERFSESIIQDISIGDNIAKVTEKLGEPGCFIDNTLFYKTNEYYLGFRGEKQVEQAVIAQKPGPYPADILKTIIENYNAIFDFDYESNTKTEQIHEFLGPVGHIHGGGWHTESMNGIFIESFGGDEITVYNNFEGELYDIRGDMYEFGIRYVDTDCIMDNMLFGLGSYISLNRRFEEDGIMSPGGKYNSLYVWNYSQSYYFIIRAMDNSTPDKYIGVAATGEYFWLNDRYILYSDFYSDAPCILDVETGETVSILEETGLFDFGGDYYRSYMFEILSSKDGIILVYYGEEDIAYRIDYSFSPDGEILLYPVAADNGE
ncbi:MAG: hypothetical protein GXZ01_11235 [Clostridiaceae bacterium]|nr:hypothetical protein [Clostridiaceae bacterium]